MTTNPEGEQGHNLSLGFALMLCAFLFFASMESSAKWLVIGSLPAWQVIFMRYLGHLLLALAFYLPRQGFSMFKSRKPLVQLLRGLFLLSSTTLNFFALKYLPLTITIAIFFAAPLIVCLLSIPLLGEKVGIQRFIAVLVGFSGVLVIAEPWGSGFNPKMMLAIGAMLSASCYFVLTRKIAGTDDNSVSQAYTAGIGTLAIFPVGLWLWKTPDSSLDWLLLCSLGVLGLIGHSLLTAAHRFAEASVLAPSVYSQIIYATFFSWVVFNEPPARNTILGTLIIVASGIFIWYRERKREQEHAQAPG